MPKSLIWKVPDINELIAVEFVMCKVGESVRDQMRISVSSAIFEHDWSYCQWKPSFAIASALFV